MTAKDASLRGIRWMLLSMFLFACLDAGIKVLARDFAAQQILAVRFAVFLALVVALVGRNRIVTVMRSRRPALQVARVLVLLAEMAVFVAAIRLLPLGDVHAVAASTPLIVTALAQPLLGERVGSRRWAAVGVGMVGLLVVIRPGLTASWAMLVPLGGAVLWAAYQILVRAVSRVDSTDTTLVYTALGGLLVTGVLAPFGWVEPDGREWALLGVVALLGAGAHVALIRALDCAPASVVQPFAYSLVVWAVVLGFALFGDVPDRWTILGSLVIVSSGLYVWHREHRVRSRPA
jgi:drug/metabolite transporter (DMT)-like permease